MSFLKIADTNYSPTNPYAGVVFKMDYREKDFTNTWLATRKVYQGTYTYQTLNDTGVIQAEEIFSNDQKAIYSMTLVCETDISGTYIYYQQQGTAPQVRTNTGRYIILEDSKGL